MAAKLPVDKDQAEALNRLLSGLARGDDAPALITQIWDLHKGVSVPGFVKQLAHR
jgi:hypothetical protein